VNNASDTPIRGHLPAQDSGTFKVFTLVKPTVFTLASQDVTPLLLKQASAYQLTREPGAAQSANVD